MTYADDRFERHSIDLLDKLSQQLSSLESLATDSRDQYRNQLVKAADSGFMTNYTNVLGGNKFNVFSKHIDSMFEIVTHSRAEMEKHKQILQELAEIARRNAQ